MEKLVVLSYDTSEVHFYDVDSEANIDEEYIENLGHNTNSCSWMLAGELSIIHHKGVLK